MTDIDVSTPEKCDECGKEFPSADDFWFFKGGQFCPVCADALIDAMECDGE